MSTVANSAPAGDYLGGLLNINEYRKVPGFVYVIQWGKEGPVKIGQAVDPNSRLRDLQTANWNRLFLAAAVPIIGDLTPVEKLAHRLAVEHMLIGEWFDLDPIDAVEYILDAAYQCGQTVYPLDETVRILEENDRLAFRSKLQVETQRHWRAVGWID